MPFTVLRTREAREAVQTMTKRERRDYDAAVEALKGQGCKAGGKRLASVGGGDYPICQRSLYAAWRLTTVYRDDGTIVIVSVEQHTDDQIPAARLAAAFTGLSATGRRRSEQPPCCEDAAEPPILSPELEAALSELLDV